MKNVVLKSSVYLLIGISAITWFVLALFSGLNLSAANDFFGLVPKVVSIDLLIIGVFVKWGWKYKHFRGWLVPFPNLNGSWVGKIYSDWVNTETGKGIPPIPVMLTINQSFFHISCMMHTTEMKSHSVSEGFNIDNDRQVKQISYIYTSRPRIRLNQRSLPHDGAIVFDIIESPNKKLIGRYWTERKTVGEIALEFYDNRILEEIPNELGKHPVTEEDKNIG